eukprot:Nk52_evm90s1810 gene=Nk52_evmTU90s1810
MKNRFIILNRTVLLLVLALVLTVLIPLTFSEGSNVDKGPGKQSDQGGQETGSPHPNPILEQIISAGAVLKYIVPTDSFKLVISKYSTGMTIKEESLSSEDEIDVVLGNPEENSRMVYFSMHNLETWMHFDIATKTFTAVPPISIFSKRVGDNVDFLSFSPTLVVQSPLTQNTLAITLPVKVVKVENSLFESCYKIAADITFRTSVWTFPPPPPLPPENCFCAKASASSSGVESNLHSNKLVKKILASVRVENDKNGRDSIYEGKSEAMGQRSIVVPNPMPKQVMDTYMSNLIVKSQKSNVGEDEKYSFSTEYAVPYADAKDVSAILSGLNSFLQADLGIPSDSLLLSAIITENEGTSYRPLLKLISRCSAIKTMETANEAIAILSTLRSTSEEGDSPGEPVGSQSSSETPSSFIPGYTLSLLNLAGPQYIPGVLGNLQSIQPSHGPLNNVIKLHFRAGVNTLVEEGEYECFSINEERLQVFQATFSSTANVNIFTGEIDCELFVKLMTETGPRVGNQVTGILDISVRLKANPSLMFGKAKQFLVYSDVEVKGISKPMIFSDIKGPYFVHVVATETSPFFDPETKGFARSFTCRFSHTKSSIVQERAEEMPWVTSGKLIEGGVKCAGPEFESQDSQQLYVEVSFNGVSYNKKKSTLTIVHPAPAYNTVQFSETGASIKVVFDIAVRYKGLSIPDDLTKETFAIEAPPGPKEQFYTVQSMLDKIEYDRVVVNCSDLLEGSMLKMLGKGPTCKILNDVLLEIELGVSLGINSVAVGSLFSLKKGVVYAANQQFSQYLTGVIGIAAPRNPPQPIVSLSGNVEVGSCDTFFLTSIGSFGNAGRQFTKITFVMNGLEMQSGISPSFELEASLKPGNYSVVVEITNWFGQAANSSWSFNKKSDPLPQVTIQGNITKTFKRNQDITLTAEAVLSSCSEVFLKSRNETITLSSNEFTQGLNRLFFKWTIMEDSIDEKMDANSKSSLKSTFKKVKLNEEYIKTRSTSILFIPKFTLESFHKYSFMLEVWSEMHPNHIARTPAFVKVISGGVEAITTSSFVTVERGNEVILDASASKDNDEPNGSGKHLQYIWKCNCTFLDRIPVDSSILQIPADIVDSTLSAFNFTVTVSNSKGYSIVDNDSASIEVSFVDGKIPTLFIEPLESKKVNSGEKLFLKGGTLEKSADVNLRWIVREDSSMPKSLQGELDIRPEDYVILEKKEILLVLSPFVLNKGLFYTFELQGWFNTSELLSISRVRVSVNSPPTLGDIKVSFNGNGTVGDMFDIQVFFTDDPLDLPLKYEFGFSTENIPPSANKSEVIRRMDASFGVTDSGSLQTFLPMNRERGNITLICMAKDQRGEIAYYMVPLFVLPIDGLVTKSVPNVSNNSVSHNSTNSTSNSSSSRFSLSALEAINNQEVLNNVALKFIDDNGDLSLKVLIAQQRFEKARSMGSFIISLLLVSSTETAVVSEEKRASTDVDVATRRILRNRLLSRNISDINDSAFNIFKDDIERQFFNLEAKRLNGYLSVLNGFKDIYSASVVYESSLLSLINTIESIFSDGDNAGTTVVEYGLQILQVEIDKYYNFTSGAKLDVFLTQKLLGVASRYIILHSPTTLSPLVYERASRLMKVTLNLHQVTKKCGEGSSEFRTMQFALALKNVLVSGEQTIEISSALGSFSSSPSKVDLAKETEQFFSDACVNFWLLQWGTSPHGHLNLTSLASQMVVSTPSPLLDTKILDDKGEGQYARINVTLTLTGLAASQYAAGFNVELKCVYVYDSTGTYEDVGCNLVSYSPQFPRPQYAICSCDINQMKSRMRLGSSFETVTFLVLALNAGRRVTTDPSLLSTGSGNGLEIGYIVGITLGISTFILGVIFWWRKRFRNSSKMNDEDIDDDKIVFETIFHGQTQIPTPEVPTKLQGADHTERIQLRDEGEPPVKEVKKAHRKKSVCFSKSLEKSISGSSPSPSKSSFMDGSVSPSTASKGSLQSILKRNLMDPDM